MPDARLNLGWIHPYDERPAALTRRWPRRQRSWGVTMLADLKPYPEVRDSGVEWLGEIPAHWETRRVRSVARVLNGATPSTNTPAYWEGDIPWITPEDLGRLKTRYINDSARRITRTGYASCATSLAPANSIAISTRAPIGHIGILKRAACVNQGCRLLIPNDEVHAEYLHYELLALRPELEAMGQGTTFLELSTGKLSGFSLAFPPLSEQAAIARFLDHADRRIRHYIRAKQKLIALLEEQKQVVFHQAVTGQIDVRTGHPYPAYKPSGVNWLGEVPRHWKLSPLKRVSCRWQNGATPPTSEVVFFENGTVPWYGPESCGTKEEVARPVRRLSSAAFSHGGARLIRGPALLIVVIGATAGRMTVMPNDGSTNQQITAFEISPERVVPRFLLRQARIAESWLRSTASSATIPILDSGVVGRLLCAVPPLVEQETIDRAVDSSVARIDELVKRGLDEISLFREYRARLITDVVTGNLDVRNAAAELPREDIAGESAEQSTVDNEVTV